MNQDVARLSIAIDSSAAKAAEQNLDRMTAAGERTESMAHSLGNTVKGLAAVLGLTAVAKQFLETNTEFQRLNTSLVTFTHSQDRANAVFGDLQQFAATTPFQLREVTQAWITMKARGMDPSMGSMRSIGDMASALGVTFEEMIGGIASASAGNTETLRRLGFGVSAVGDKVRITYDGMSQTVNRTSYDIEQAITKVSNAKFQGGMERQINTLGGALSNLKDQIDNTFFAMGQSGANTAMVRGIQEISCSIDKATPSLIRFTEAGVSGAVSSVQWLDRHKNAVLALGTAYASVKIGQAV